MEAVMWRILNVAPDLGEEALDPRLRPVVIQMLKKDPAERPSAQEVLDQLSGLGRDATGTIAQLLNLSWILPANEVIHVDSHEGGRDRVDVDTREEVSTPAGAAGDPHSAGRAADWYPDPQGNGGLRRFDSIAWTDDFADAPSIESQSLSPAGTDQVGERPDGRPGTRYTRTRLMIGGIGVLVLISTAAVIGALQLTNAPRRSTSGTTITPAAHSRASGSTLAPPSATQGQSPNQPPTSTSTQAGASLAVSRDLAAKAIPPPDGYAGGPGNGMYPTGFITTTVYDQGAGAGSAASDGFLGGYEATYNDTSDDFIDMQLLRYSSPQEAGQAEGPNLSLLPSDSAKQSAFPGIPGAIAVNGTKQTYGSYHHEVVATKGPVLMLIIYSIPTSGPMPAALAAWAQQQYAHV
jgi:hypothetical protein